MEKNNFWTQNFPYSANENYTNTWNISTINLPPIKYDCLHKGLSTLVDISEAKSAKGTAIVILLSAVLSTRFDAPVTCTADVNPIWLTQLIHTWLKEGALGDSGFLRAGSLSVTCFFGSDSPVRLYVA